MEDASAGDVAEVIVVGGGDNGLLTALLLHRFNPAVDITVIDDFDEAQPAVGKSTIVYILETLHTILDIDERRFISEVRPAWKASIWFEDWCGSGPFHVPFDEYGDFGVDAETRPFQEQYHRYQHSRFHTLGCELAEQGRTPFKDDFSSVFSQVAYHLPVHSFNRFLREVCRERGLALVNDTISRVRTSDDSTITAVEGDATEYEADLYVDASGFNRVLMGALANDFEPFGYPIDAALVAKTDVETADIVPATVVRSGDHGWFWQIDTLDWRDLGYVHSSDHVSHEAALDEFMSFVEDRSGDGDIARSEIDGFGWEAGVHERAWVGNCVAIGNALGFLEPLQSTTYTLNALLTEQLARLLDEHQRLNHPGIRRIYNRLASTIWGNVYDFVGCHYTHAAGTNEFWDAMGAIETRDTLDQIVVDYQENGFSSHDLLGVQNGLVFPIFDQHLFYILLRSLGVTSAFYERLDLDPDPDVTATVDAQAGDLEREAETYQTYEELVESGFFEP